MMGIQVNGYNIALDVNDSASNLNFVSHAHSDHTSGIRKNKSIISSSITRELIEARSKLNVNLVDTPPGIELLNAGHILGSKQLYAYSEKTGSAILYSGDYQMQQSQTAERIETKEADTLIIDSTYPYKDVQFDERSEVINTIQCYLKSKISSGIIIFGVYALGKAQEIIRVVNNIGMTPVVDKNISMINKVYSRAGVKLDYASMYDQGSEFSSVVRDNFVGLVSMSDLNRVKERISAAYNKKVYTAVATGFAKFFRFNTDVQFALSDHADFKQALEYIEACDPKVIYTYGREESKEVFAKNLCSVGYNAHSFDSNNFIGDFK